MVKSDSKQTSPGGSGEKAGNEESTRNVESVRQARQGEVKDSKKAQILDVVVKAWVVEKVLNAIFWGSKPYNGSVISI